MKNTHAQIHVIVGINGRFLQYQKARNRLELLARPLFQRKRRAKSPKTIAKIQKEIDLLTEKAKVLREKDPGATCGGTCNLGYYIAKIDATQAIEDYPDTLSEAGYYQLLVVERKPEGLGRFDWGPGAETWFKLQEDGNYKRCRKPACFQGTVDFAS